MSQQKMILGSSSDADSEGGYQTVMSKSQLRLEKRRRTKRARDELDTSVEDDVRDSIINCDKISENVKYVEVKINSVLNDPDKKISKKAAGELLELVSDLTDTITKLMTRNIFLKGVLDGKDKQIYCIEKALDDIKRDRDRDKSTYATVAGTVRQSASRPPPITGSVRRTFPEKKYTAIVKMVNETEKDTADTIKERFLATIDPVGSKLHVESIRKLRSKKVVVEVQTQEDLAKIISTEGLATAGLKVEASDKKQPRIQIFDVPSDMTSEACMEALYEQNNWVFKNISRQDLESNCRFVFRTGRKDMETTNWVLEVTPLLRNIMRSAEKVYIGTYRCRIVDFTRISRCFKCQGLGHISTTCGADKDTCGFCAEQGHRTKDCGRKELRKCAICKRMNKDFNHASDDKCPYYMFLIERQRNRTDYG